MIQVVYKRYQRSKFNDTHGYECIEYFPNWKSAMILISRWNNQMWIYEIVECNEVTDYNNQQYHSDVFKYRHLWE